MRRIEIVPQRRRAVEPIDSDPGSTGRRLERRFHRSMYLGAQQVRGRPIGRLMRQLAEWDSLDAASYAALSRARLEQMLSFAAERVPLYRSERWSDVEQSPADLARWPLLERSTIADDREALIPDGTIRALLFPRRSSASTGTPVVVPWTLNGVAWSWAAEYHPMGWHGLEIGARTLRMWGSSLGLENFVLNRHFVPAHDLTPERLDEAVHYLETRKPDLVWGTPSAVHELARHIGRTRGPSRAARVPFVKVGGEQLYAFQRDDILRHLGDRVIESYGCTEVGPIAAECPAGSLHVLTTNVHLEIFRDGLPAAPGELGEVVATTLVNRGMPLVRCRIGDLGVLSPDPCPCGRPQPVLAELQGRAADLVFKPDGTPIHGSLLGRALERYAGQPPLGAAQKVQFEQLDRCEWKVRIELHETPDREALERQLGELMRNVLGADCRLDVEVVPSIEREPSGKFRYYRSLGARRHPSPGTRPLH
ncbi:MAG TPA: hypothetical protein VF339_05030 [Gammaproteobacteria bacterium]